MCYADRIVRLTLFLCLLTACPRPVPPLTAVRETRHYAFPETTSPWGRHAGADVCFPTTPPVGWRFGGTRHYDNPAGLDLSWSYGDDNGTVLTVYVYPQHSPAPEGMSREEAEARAAGNEVADVAWEVTGQVAPLFGGPGFLLGGVQQQPLAPLIPVEMQAEVAQKLGVASLDGVTRAFGTLVLVWAADPWFVEMRVTWLDDKRPAADVAPELIGWSAVPCSVLVTAGGSVPVADVPAEGLPAQAP